MRMTTNNLMSNVLIDSTVAVKPEVGLGATLCWYTDRHAATVIEVWEERGKTYIKVQQDIAKRTDNYGMSDCQDYEYERDPNGCTYVYRWNQNKMIWDRVYKAETGRWRKTDSPVVALGYRREYYDYSF